MTDNHPLRAGLRRLARRLLRATPGAQPVVSAPASAPGPFPVTFSGRGPVAAPAGISLLHLARDHDIELSHYCGGMASCGTCRVEILGGAGNLSAMDGRERMVLGDEAARAGNRLACQARVLGPADIRIPRWF